MSTDPKRISEEKLNRRRKVEHKLEQEDDGIVETVDRAFESVVSPFKENEINIPDEEDIEDRREANDEASRP
jgi:hypothetical protein